MATTDASNTTGTELEILKRIEKSYKEKFPNVSKYKQEALDWFRSYIPKSYNNVQTSTMFRDRKLWKQTLSLGKLYFFEYDALHKDELPIWDRYPIVFPFSVWKTSSGATGFVGLNLHYLSPKHRMLAYITLLKFRTETRYRKSTKLDLDWQVLAALADSKYFKHAVHSYRFDHVKSVFVEIPSQSWGSSIFLPLARWQKGTSKDAYKLKS